jgi:hypothetical protein
MQTIPTVHLATASIVTALKPPTIGTRVTNLLEFFRVAQAAVEGHDFTQGKVPGQAYIECPELVPFVSAGIGPKSSRPEDYVCREHRGVVAAYLKRKFAATPTGCALVVYTKQAYFDDPEVTTDEVVRINENGATHIIVAVLAFAGPASALSTHRFVSNLAGGNREAALWTADEIRAKAKEVLDYKSAWSTVADGGSSPEEWG